MSVSHCALFVYGTLQRGHGPHERLLARHLVSATPATTRGVLHLHPEGWPVLVVGAPGVDAATVVHGELLVLGGTQVLAAVDAYEDCDPASPETSLYRRVQVEVGMGDTLDGTRQLAWTYVGRPVGPVISGGRWRASY